MTDQQSGISGRDWIKEFADRLGTFPPSEIEMEALLDLAGVAAHDSERLAAPLACWLIAKAGLSPSEGLKMAEALVSERTR
ncbi:MAG: DUF6457 domain-containing protein [Acidimicrobiales bacterium]|jgi:hypothetical protein|nr:DUF6457 domain-containing protein [Acidimicrobiales bacterium]